MTRPSEACAMPGGDRLPLDAAAAAVPPAPRLTDAALTWIDALGLGPVFVRRELIATAGLQPEPVAAMREEPAVAARSDTVPEATPVGQSRPVVAPRPDGATSAAGAAVGIPGCATTAGCAERSTLIAAMDWAELEATTQACRACRLGSSRHQAVFGTGSIRARWLIVGEAPGAEEDRLGEPFVGAAGKLLDAMLAAVGLDRRADDASAVYIANVLKCRPPGNRNPTPDEVAQCAPLLQRQIALLRPSLILALGRFAAQALLDSSAPISQLRGRIHRYGDVPVVVSYHPAYLLRNPADKSKVWRDLCLARDIAAGASA
jgi:DNA polymerase